MTTPRDPNSDAYVTKYNNTIVRTGKIFSYTFWRTQINNDIFWSVQGNAEDGSAWIATEYFGPTGEAHRYQQIIILTHPVETKIKMVYYSTCEEGRNHIFISKSIVENFKNDDNSFNFEFKLMRLKRRPKQIMANICQNVQNCYFPIQASV